MAGAKRTCVSGPARWDTWEPPARRPTPLLLRPSPSYSVPLRCWDGMGICLPIPFSALMTPATARAVCKEKGSHDEIRDSHTQGAGRSQQAAPGHLHRLFASQERDQMKDPRKRWGLSDTCHREPVDSSLSKAKCFNTTALAPKNYSCSSLPSGPRPEAILAS
jgi:hypothetical protein